MNFEETVRFTAQSVDCSEAIDWEIVQVCFDSEMPQFDDVDRKTPYLLLSVNHEFDGDVTVEYFAGNNYGGGHLSRFEMGRDHVTVTLAGTAGFEIQFDVSDSDFDNLVYHLERLLPRNARCTNAEQGRAPDASPGVSFQR